MLAIRASVRPARLLFWGAETAVSMPSANGDMARTIDGLTVSMPSRHPEAQALAAGHGQHGTAQPGVPYSSKAYFALGLHDVSIAQDRFVPFKPPRR